MLKAKNGDSGFAQGVDMSDAKRRERVPLDNKPIVEIEHHSYQPTKEELEADISIPGVTPEELAGAVLRDVVLVRKPPRKSKS